MKKQQDVVTIRLESHRPSSTRSCAAAAGRMAREMNLNISAQGHYKKKNQLKITLISGPHVHKKSRDQYKIDRFGAFLVICGGSRHLNRSPSAAMTSGEDPAGQGAGGGVSLDPAKSETPQVDSVWGRRPRRGADKFLEFKNKLYRLNLDEGFSLTFTYLNRETFVL